MASITKDFVQDVLWIKDVSVKHLEAVKPLT